MKIILIDLFSGIGGFPFGLEEAGFTITKHYFSEIDKHAIANYKNNFKDAEYIGSITTVCGNEIRRKHPNEKIVITFGSPCQDFSLAGKRQGMQGQRSSLIMEAMRLILEIKPNFYIWENVKGTFSSNHGADFWAILNAFTNIGNYRLEWQLLNTSWFLPQNRERIYLIGHLAGRSTPGVFPITENDRLFNQTNQSKKGRTQTEISTCLKSSGTLKADDTFIIPKKAGTLTAGGNSGGLHSDMTVIPVLTPNRKEKRQNGRRFKENGDPSFTLSCQDQHGVMIGTNRTHKDGKGFRKMKDNLCPTIPARARQDGSGQPVISSKNQIRRLTEIECERLQGFYDNWTKYGNYDGTIKEISKTQRYKMCGNAVSTVVVKAIGERLINTQIA
ncbi:DNA (cytosine-5)-methyltransferase 1 [Mesonia algae]|uniref:DNA (cytosine-5-)-methyltransferase n=1 Tax=Mesonia algae TaxID=213248 RepID=A0A2W7I4J7_9FLAO|nr:DNA cytosine methyltransferase [Mesonia algae]PZW41604.1 DNA (cytosine-5)-methyltransferase 1 [Mesonia algae]